MNEDYKFYIQDTLDIPDVQKTFKIKKVMPIDIDTYRIIYTHLHKKLPANLCHIITDYISRRIIV